MMVLCRVLSSTKLSKAFGAARMDPVLIFLSLQQDKTEPESFLLQNTTTLQLPGSCSTAAHCCSLAPTPPNPALEQKLAQTHVWPHYMYYISVCNTNVMGSMLAKGAVPSKFTPESHG
jgi:hypothetical protein